MKNVAEEIANDAGSYEQCFVDHRAKVLTDRIIEVLVPSEENTSACLFVAGKTYHEECAPQWFYSIVTKPGSDKLCAKCSRLLLEAAGRWRIIYDMEENGI